MGCGIIIYVSGGSRSVVDIMVHIDNYYLPSLKLPFNPKTFDTAGRTKNMVDVPVIPKTVHSNAISAYHRGVFFGGIGLGPKNRCRKVVDRDDDDDDDNELFVKFGDDSEAITDDDNEVEEVAVVGGADEHGNELLLALLLTLLPPPPPPFHRRCE